MDNRDPGRPWHCTSIVQRFVLVRPFPALIEPLRASTPRHGSCTFVVRRVRLDPPSLERSTLMAKPIKREEAPEKQPESLTPAELDSVAGGVGGQMGGLQVDT